MILIFILGLVALRILYSVGEVYYERDWPRDTWKGLLIALGVLCIAISAFGQAVRIDIPLQTSGPSVPISGGPLPQALWVANAAAYLCTHPSATLAACQAAPITTYTDSTEGTTCPTATPLVQLPGNTCTAATGTTANVGFWYGGGVFDYWIVSSYGTYGPFSGNSGGVGSGCPTTGCAFTGPVSAPIVNGIYAASNFGVKCDGVTDDSTALNSIGTFALAQAAGETVTVSFPSNVTCIHASSITAWNVSSLHIKGNGSRLKFTGSGKQIYLHGSAGEVDNLEIGGFVLQGNSGSTDGVYQDNGVIARSTLDLINVQDQSHSCYYLSNWELSTKLNLPCSSNLASVMGVAQVTQPQYGAIAGDPSAYGGGFFANNRVVNLSIEGTGVIGLWCKHCTNQNHFYGTSEGTSSSGGTVGVGLQDYTTLNDGWSGSNTFSLDLEGNAVADANISGFSEIFLSVVDLGTFNILGGSGSLIGGEYQTIVKSNEYAPWNFQNFYYNALQTTGTFTGYTCADTVQGVWNFVGGAISTPLCTLNPYNIALSFPLGFTNGVSNQKIDLYLPPSQPFSGEVLVSLTDTYAGNNNYGSVKKLIMANTSGTGSIYGQTTRYVEAEGTYLAATYAINDLAWDSTNSRYKITIACITPANCSTSPYLVANVTAFSDSPSAITAVAKMAASAVYTTDATVYPTPVVSYPRAVIATGGVDVGTLASPISVIPSTALGYQGPAAGYVQLALAPSAITSATGGTNTGTVTCLTAACTNISGTYSVVGSTFTTGNLLVLVWPTTTTAYHCWTSQNGGVATYGIGHSVATATGMTITAGISVATATVTIDYGCSAN